MSRSQAVHQSNHDDPTHRFEVDPKKSKVEEYCSRKQNVFSTEQLHIHLSNDENVKDDSCKMSLSKSLVGGSTNVCKRRVLNFQGNGFSCVPTGMIMSVKPNDGTVAMHIGEILEEVQYTTLEDYLPTLPNTHFADLLAAQFCSLMVREGYLVEDHVQPRPISMNRNETNMPPNGSVAEGVSGQLSNELARPSNCINSPQNMQGQIIQQQISQGLLTGVAMPSRPQQSDPLSPLQQQQLQCLLRIHFLT